MCLFKVITQAAHGPAIQIQSVPVSSVSQPTQIAITTVVTRPGKITFFALIRLLL